MATSCEIGQDYKDKGADHTTWGITVTGRDRDWRGDLITWYNQIHVYGDPDLRDHILRLLNENPMPEKPR